MAKFIRTAIDLGKNNFQVHAVESEGGRVTPIEPAAADILDHDWLTESRPHLLAEEPPAYRWPLRQGTARSW